MGLYQSTASYRLTGDIVRRVLAIVFLLAAALLATWLFAGRQISKFIDQFGTVEISSDRVASLVYEGPGSGGLLRINNLELALNGAVGWNLHVGTTKDGQIALADRGKLFAFGPAEAGDERLAAAVPLEDKAVVEVRRSILSWPIQFNFITGQSPLWEGHIYYRLEWAKPSGAKLEMLWRCERQFDCSTGWERRCSRGRSPAGLVRIEIRQ